MLAEFSTMQICAAPHESAGEERAKRVGLLPFSQMQVPEGPPDNSPAFPTPGRQAKNGPLAGATPEANRFGKCGVGFRHPYGMRFSSVHYPALETPGYCRVVPPGPFLNRLKIKKPSKMFEGSGMRQKSRKNYFSDFTYSATALASSPATPLMAFLCGAFLASSPLASRSVI